MTPYEFYAETIGKAYDVDGAYGAQCVDGFRLWCNWNLGYSWRTPNNYADGYWYSRKEHSDVFFFVDDPKDFRDGDWVIWAKGSKSHPSTHIAMYLRGCEYGQNQGGLNGAFNSKQTDFSDALGALRWKGYVMNKLVDGQSKVFINGHLYTFYKQREGQKIGVLSAGVNKLKTLNQHDADALIYAKIAGANYYQMRADQADSYGTTYGDVSSTLNDVYLCFSNQDTTLFYDLNTGEYGDCTGVVINPLHDVFSPAVVYPKEGNFQYARMVGINHVNIKSMYTFVIRFTDGKYCLGITNEEMTIKTIAEDMRTIEGFESCAFLDGGGSAQMKTGFETILDTQRPIPSCVCIYKEYDTDTSTNDNDLSDDSDSDETGAGVTQYQKEIDDLKERIEVLEKAYERLRRAINDD